MGSKHLFRRQIRESGPSDSERVAGSQFVLLLPATRTDGPLSVTHRLARRPVVF